MDKIAGIDVMPVWLTPAAATLDASQQAAQPLPASKELALQEIAARGAQLEAQLKSLERRLFEEQDHSSGGPEQPTAGGEGGATPVALCSEPPGACSQIGFASDEHDHGLRPVAAPCAHDATAAAAAWATQEHLEDELELASVGGGAARRLWFAALLRSMYGAVRHDPGRRR
jgi:hypothetical protein